MQCSLEVGFLAYHRVSTHPPREGPRESRAVRWFLQKLQNWYPLHCSGVWAACRAFVTRKWGSLTEILSTATCFARQARRCQFGKMVSNLQLGGRAMATRKAEMRGDNLEAENEEISNVHARETLKKRDEEPSEPLSEKKIDLQRDILPTCLLA